VLVDHAPAALLEPLGETIREGVNVRLERLKDGAVWACAWA
jgi:hypothetical protein